MCSPLKIGHDFGNRVMVIRFKFKWENKYRYYVFMVDFF